MSSTQLINIRQAAAQSGLGEWAIRTAIRRGELTAVNVGTGQRQHLRVTLPEVQRLKAALAARTTGDPNDR